MMSPRSGRMGPPAQGPTKLARLIAGITQVAAVHERPDAWILVRTAGYCGAVFTSERCNERDPRPVGTASGPADRGGHHVRRRREGTTRRHGMPRRIGP